jgi:hypothetical protein
VKFFVPFTFLPYLDIFGTLSLSGQPSKSDGLLIQPYALFLKKFLLKLSEDLNVRLNEDLLLSLLLFEDTLDLFDLGVESVQQVVAAIDFHFFLLEDPVFVLQISSETLQFI